MTLLSFKGRKAPGVFHGRIVAPFRINPIIKVMKFTTIRLQILTCAWKCSHVVAD